MIELSGFRTRDAAVEFLSNDILHTCEYCEEELPITTLGEVVETTYTKKRPEDVVGDVVVTLGVLYFTTPIDFRVCDKCGHTNHRNNVKL